MAWRFVLVGALIVGGVPFGGAAAAQGPGPVDPRLFVIGDSVMLGAKDAVGARFGGDGWQVHVYAQEGLSTLATPSILDANRPLIGDVVVVGLGDNDMGNPAVFGQRVDGVMRALSSVHRVIWVNLRRFASWVPAYDQQLSMAAGRWPTLEIADWDARSTPDPSLVFGDGLHLTPPGRTAMAELIAQHVDAYVQQRRAAATSTSTSTTTTTAPRPRPRPRPRRHTSSSSRVPLVLGASGGALAVVGAAWGVTRATRRRRRVQTSR